MKTLTDDADRECAMVALLNSIELAQKLCTSADLHDSTLSDLAEIADDAMVALFNALEQRGWRPS